MPTGTTTTAEPGLDRSGDPSVLVAADLPAIDGLIGHLEAVGTALERTARGLRGIQVGQWSGAAADAFRARFDESPVRWADGADAFADAAGACRGFATAVGRARQQAARAAELYRRGVEASAAAVRRYDDAVTGHNAQVTLASVSGGAAPAPLPAFTDPGAPMVEQAVRMLDAARADRDTAGAQAARAVRAAAATAPDPPSGLDRLGAEIGDTLTEGGRVLDGVVDGGVGLAKFARSLNPLDLSNVTHPAAFVGGLSSTVAGLGGTIVHPTRLVTGTVGTGWGSDPGHAAGELVPGALLAAATDGGGAAVRAVSDRMAARAIRKARPPVKTAEPPHLADQNMLGIIYGREETGESLAFPGQTVRYLDDIEREEYRLTVHDGRLYTATGRPFSSEPGGSGHSADSRSIFVMDRHGNLYASNGHIPGRFHHSSFLAGDSVSGAGEMKVVDGRLELVSDQSGHYRPSEQMTANVFEELSREGVDIRNVEFEKHAN